MRHPDTAVTSTGRAPPMVMTPEATGMLIKTRTGKMPASAITNHAAIGTESAHATTKTMLSSWTTTQISASAPMLGAMRTVRKINT